MKHWKRIATVAGMVLALFGGTIAVAGPALADDSSELPSCKYYWTGIGGPYGGGHYTGSGDWYAYGPQLTSPSNSACEDIQIVALYSMSPWMKFRVRFYPSGGGNYANSWKYVPGNFASNFVIATNVANNTVWRIEGVEQVSGCPSCTQTVLDENFDVNA